MLSILIVLLIAGAILFLVEHAPIDAYFKLIAKVLIVVFVLVWAIRLLAGANVLPF